MKPRKIPRHHAAEVFSTTSTRGLERGTAVDAPSLATAPGSLLRPTASGGAGESSNARLIFSTPPKWSQVPAAAKPCFDVTREAGLLVSPYSSFEPCSNWPACSLRWSLYRREPLVRRATTVDPALEGAALGKPDAESSSRRPYRNRYLEAADALE